MVVTSGSVSDSGARIVWEEGSPLRGGWPWACETEDPSEGNSQALARALNLIFEGGCTVSTHKAWSEDLEQIQGFTETRRCQGACQRCGIVPFQRVWWEVRGLAVEVEKFRALQG